MLDHHQSQHHQHAQPTAFAEGESETEEKIQQFGVRISTGSAKGPIIGTPISPTARWSSGTSRFNSSVSALNDSTTTLTNCEDKLSSPPPKYIAEDLEYSEPPRHSCHDEEGGLGYHNDENGQGDGLLMQASTTLVFAVTGLICAGWLLDVIQANMGLLDHRESRNAFIKGNLALLQVQSLTVGSVAGLFAFGLGVIVHPTTNNPSEIALMITSSMLCAALSSFVLGSFMCGLVLVCRRYRINPDNIACPLASSFGDLVTLLILAGCSMALEKILHTPYPVILLVILLAQIPAWAVYVRRNKFVSEVVKEGWVPVFAAMVIASTAGLTLERYINEFPGMALISPVLNGLAGNIASIFASRISTSLHVNIKENYKSTQRILFFVHIPIQAVFLVITGVLGLGHVQWSVPVVLGYLFVTLCLILISLGMARSITHLFWKWGYDPDNYALPILTSLIDVIGTGLLVAGFWALRYGKME
ncbi:hypothetical protein BGZ79_007042 [Entomortierella chlamydospora]|nr:hypothetical protein BGZ79_007042 [Entomortierella chlamydospora]